MLSNNVNLGYLFSGGLSPLGSPLPQDHVRIEIPGSNSGTAATIGHMQRLVSDSKGRWKMRQGVDNGKRDFKLRTLVGSLIQSCGHKDYECYARKCYDFCATKIKYAYDPVNVELIEAPERILESKIADCDSICVLLASMCENIGLPCKFVTIKADPANPNEFSHVYTMVGIPQKNGKPRKWIAMDPTMPQKGFGWEPPPAFPRKEWPASTDPLPKDGNADMMGLGEGPIPGVSDIRLSSQGPANNYREINYPDGVSGQGILGQRGKSRSIDGLSGIGEIANLGCCGSSVALSGCSCGGECGPCSKGRGGMDGIGMSLGETVDPLASVPNNALSILVGVADGSLYSQLKKIKSQLESEEKDIAIRRADIASMPNNAMKNQANGLITKAQSIHTINKRNYIELVDKYNDVAETIEAYSFGSVKPPRLALAPAVWGAIYLALGAGVIFSISSLISSIRQGNTSVRSTLDQLKDVIEAGGGALSSVGGIFDSLKWAALAGGALYVGYLGVKHFKGARR